MGFLVAVIIHVTVLSATEVLPYLLHLHLCLLSYQMRSNTYGPGDRCNFKLKSSDVVYTCITEVSPAMASQEDLRELLRLMTTGRNKLPMMAAMGRVKSLQAANIRRYCAM